MSNDYENSNSNDDGGQIVALPGGGFRYQVGARSSEQPAPQQAAPSGKWVGDLNRVTVRDGKMIQETVASVTKSSDAPTEGDGHWLDTARTTSGRPLGRGEIDENSIVKVPGAGEFQVKTLLRDGTLIKDRDGRIVEAPKTQPNAFDKFDQQQPSAPSAEAGEALDAEGEKLAQTIIDQTREMDRVAAIREIIDGHGLSPATLERVASSMKVDPDKAAGMVEALVSKFSDQAAKAVAQVAPVELQDVATWARTNNPKALKAAMRSIAEDDKGAGFRALTQDYLADLPSIDPGLILNAEMPEGVTAYERDGRVILRTPHGEVDWKSAIRSGFVTVSRRGRR
ncbi:hypothetical protein FRZ61_33020 [Hypericibacter adhaerens]|uniref:Uncharacterized protein n=1 Tax=Hypericibacter adhaerens TaxID=2602016 RepID=A0A5J6N219_9PROT|nr:hypothetical protein [Hypericibacter adhaerens]QEX23364.1 hypothetical protein FRZ61_33020 [Hypericibacter adhaerens]